MTSTTDAATRARPVESSRRGLLTGVDHAATMGMELVAGILLYAGLGGLADRWLGTGPWLLVVGALLGNGAGIYLIWLRSGRMHAEEQAKRARGVARAG